MKYQRRGVTFNAAVFHSKIRTYRSRSRRSCSSRIVFTCRSTHEGIEAEFAVDPATVPRSVARRELVERGFDSTIENPALVTSTCIREATACRRCRSSRWPQLPPTLRAQRQCRMVHHGQLPACRQPLHAPADQANNPRASRITCRHSFRLARSRRSTLIAQLQPREPVAGINWIAPRARRLRDNLFDKRPSCRSTASAAGAHSLGYNVGLPRIIGLTALTSRAPRLLQRRLRLLRRPAPPPATQTCPTGRWCWRTRPARSRRRLRPRRRPHRNAAIGAR